MKSCAVTVVILFTFLPACTHFLKLGAASSHARLSENRALAQWPIWQGFCTKAVDYTGQIETYVNDNFGFRAAAIKFYSAASVRLGLVGPAVRGKTSGWYFLSSSQIWLSYKGNTGFTVQDIDLWMQNLSAFKNAVVKDGARFAAIIAPNKARVYPEHAPKSYGAASPRRFVNGLYNHPKANLIGLYNIQPRLLRVKRASAAYYKTDTHWTETGAYEGYAAALEQMNRGDDVFPVLEKNQRKKSIYKDYSGDLAALLGRKGEITETALVFKAPPMPTFTKTIIDEMAGMDGWAGTIYSNGAAQGVTLVIIGDSFADSMVSYFKHSFDKIVQLKRSDGSMHIQFDAEKILDLRPDAVLFITVERNAERWQGYLHR